MPWNLSKIPIYPILGICLGLFGYDGIQRNFVDNRIPNTKEVQSGYIAPDSLEIKCKDLDKTDREGLPETYFKVGDETYVLMWDRNRKPILLEYDVKPQEVVPKISQKN